MAPKAEPGPLSAIFGKAKGGAEPPEADPEESGLPEDFEDYALTAFPELEGDDARLQALYNAMKACT